MADTSQVKTSEFHVYERNLYEMPQRQPLTNGVLDRRLGTSDKKGECATCHGKLQDCAGHFGACQLSTAQHTGLRKKQPLCVSPKS